MNTNGCGSLLPVAAQPGSSQKTRYAQDITSSSSSAMSYTNPVSVCGCLQLLVVVAVVGRCFYCFCGCGLLLLLRLWVVSLDIVVGAALLLSFNFEPTLPIAGRFC